MLCAISYFTSPKAKRPSNFFPLPNLIFYFRLSAGEIAVYGYLIAKMAQWLQVSKSNYYAWRRRTPSARQLENRSLLEQIRRIHEASRGTYGSKKIPHYGPFHRSTYSCEVAPTDTPERVATALVSQTDYLEVRDDYAVYYFKEDAEALVLVLCGTKDYVIDQRISLEMPGTEKAWTSAQ